MSTRHEMAKALKFRKALKHDYLMYFLSLAHNVLNVENLPPDLPKRYLLKTLITKGKIGHYNGLYLPVSEVGVDIYGLPTQCILIGYNGVTFTADAKDVGILRINDQAYPLYPFLEVKAEQLANIDCAINQNVEAIKTMRVYGCKDEATLLSLKNMAKATEIGSIYAFIQKNTGIDSSVTVMDTGAQYLGDKLNELKRQILDEVLTKLGIASANTSKRERVQAAEVAADIVQTVDSISVMVDTFNYDAEVANLPLRLSLNTYTTEVLANQGENNNDGNSIENRI